MARVFMPGDRCVTPCGPGVVQWVRNGPPTFEKPFVYSVRLDSVTRPDYSGSVFPAEQVSEEIRP